MSASGAPGARRGALRGLAALGTAAALPGWLTGGAAQAGGGEGRAVGRPDGRGGDSLRFGHGQGPVGGEWIGASVGRGHRLHSPGPPTASTGAAGTAPGRRTEVLIVGAGIAGLACARALRRAGVEDLCVLELEDVAGGNSRGHVIGGMACPMGAHYLPLPGPEAPEVSEWLHEIGLLETRFGRTRADERHLCHSPQERLFVDGHWREGLLPPPDAFGRAGDAAGLQAQYERFAAEVATVRAIGFAMPASRAPWTDTHRVLDGQTFAGWLDARGLVHPGLRWYLDYACRDDYGAPAAVVSAWAGLHYFASRHGFTAPGGAAGDDAGREPVLTWPEGNAWLVRHLASGLGERLATGRVVLGLTVPSRASGEIELVAWNAQSDGLERWQARQVVLAVPLAVAHRLAGAALPGADPLARALASARGAVRSAPWLVAHLQLRAPLADRIGAPPAWDNVVFGEPGLGWVDAQHQSTRSVAAATVLSAYNALGGEPFGWPGAARGFTAAASLREGAWADWARWAVAPVLAVHPDLPMKLLRVDLARHGHAMAVPVPGLRGHPALVTLREQGLAEGRLHLAHADLAGYSVFEEAFTLGDAVGRRVAGRLGAPGRVGNARPFSPASRPRSPRPSPAPRG